MAERCGDVASLVDHPDFAISAPTDEHFLPLLYIADAPAAVGKPAEILVDGYAFGSLSMTSYGVGATCPKPDQNLAGSVTLSTDFPADESNI